MTQKREEIGGLTTETRNPRTLDLDVVSTVEMVQMINDENRLLADGVDREKQQIAKAVDLIAQQMRQGGRLIYIGAGTSGRLGVLDASECPPTFSMDPGDVVGIIAGGDSALRKSSEDAEDDPEAIRRQLDEIGFNKKDVLCGIAASGRTPYVISGLKYARELGVATICVANNKNSAMAAFSDIPIEVDVGPEALTGSTRMKAGTAQKLVLNILTTGAAVKLGKTYSNLMVDMKASNQKLKLRCVNILKSIVPDKTLEQYEAALAEAGESVKLAALILSKNLGKAQAQALLDQHEGYLRRALEA